MGLAAAHCAHSLGSCSLPAVPPLPPVCSLVVLSLSAPSSCCCCRVCCDQSQHSSGATTFRKIRATKCTGRQGRQHSMQRAMQRGRREERKRSEESISGSLCVSDGSSVCRCTNSCCSLPSHPPPLLLLPPPPFPLPLSRRAFPSLIASLLPAFARHSIGSRIHDHGNALFDLERRIV